MASSKDVAKLAGVSIATVSRVLTGQGNIVSEKSQEKVRQAALQLGYAPNQIARSLRARHTNTIGLLIPNSSNPFFLQVMNILATDLKQYGFNLLVSFCQESKADEYLNVLSLLSARVEAILFTPVCRNEDVLRQLQTNKTYALQLNRKMYDELDFLIWDDEDGVYRATSYLFGNGFRRPMLLGPVATRRMGFERALAEQGLPLGEGQILQTKEVDIDRSQLRDGIRKFKPDALITVAHETNYCALNLLKQWGMRYPQDISVICYDDDELTRFLEMTVVAHDLEKQGHMACDLLMASLEDAPYTRPPVAKLLKTKLIKRKSVLEK